MANVNSDQKKELFGDVKVRLTVELGRTTKSISEALNLAPGSILEMKKSYQTPVEVYINKMLFARGDVVTIDETFGVRVTEVMDKERRYSVLQKLI